MRKKIALLLTLVMSLAAFTPAYSAEPAASVQVQTKALPQVGEELYGFKVTARGKYPSVSAETVTMEHIKSGATLVYVKNDDENLAFDIGFKTPQTDESDRNHVFEHAIIASSEKYPSSDLFFDISNKTFNTYVNATTSLVSTDYQLASMSQPQLEKMIDAYMSCIVEPLILKNENIFKREAINYTLESKDADIELGGTVFSEDMAHLSNPADAYVKAMLDTLYPNEIASNMLGRSVENYKILTYEHTKDMYDMCYHFDNALITLYGDMDYRSILKFLDEQYLSKAENNHTDLSKYIDGKSKDKFVDTTYYYPVYQEDKTEDSAFISYAIDLDGYAEEDILSLVYISAMLNNDNSILSKKLEQAGISNSFSCDVSIDSAKPYICIYLENTNPDVKDKFKQIVLSTIKEIAKNGIGDDYANFMKASEIERNIGNTDSNSGINILSSIITYWAATGRTDLPDIDESAFKALCDDKEQTIVKNLFKKLSNPANSAIITVLPKPGMAEEIHKERADYLAKMKANMTDAEIDKLIADTKAYNEWNSNQVSYGDITIKPEDLPQPKAYPAVNKKTDNSLTSYSVEIDKDIAMHGVIFDCSSVTQEDLLDYTIFFKLLGILGTSKYTSDELATLIPVYLSNLNIEQVYITNAGESAPKLALKAEWYCLNEDYEKSLDLLLNIISETDFDNKDDILYQLESALPETDIAKADSFETAQINAIAGVDSNKSYNKYISEKSYDYMSEVINKLKTDSSYHNTFKTKIENIAKQVYHKDNIIAYTIGNKGSITSAEKINGNKLNALPTHNMPRAIYNFEQLPKTSAYIVESSNQHSVVVTELDDDFKGNNIPYIAALNDIYVIPMLRFQNGVYSAGMNVSFGTANTLFSYAYADPKAYSSVDIIKKAGSYLSETEFSQKDLDSYIISAYSTVVSPSTPYSLAKKSILMDIYGVDKSSTARIAQEIKQTTLADKAEAAAAIDKAMAEAYAATVGNRDVIKGESASYDKVTDYTE